MRARSVAILSAILFVFAGAGLFAQSAATPVSLGVFVGTAFPQGNTATFPDADATMNFNWGFFVNIPLIQTFAITPSAELYKLGKQNATDFDLAFKFIVPVQKWSIFAGFSPGLTAGNEVIDPHVGLLAGASMNLVSNIDAFAQVKYDFIFDGSENLKVLHVNAGLIFNF
jgi:hypothetical protein